MKGLFPKRLELTTLCTLDKVFMAERCLSIATSFCCAIIDSVLLKATFSCSSCSLIVNSSMVLLMIERIPSEVPGVGNACLENNDSPRISQREK